MHNKVVSILKDTSVSKVLQQLLAPYWIFDIKYPRAYESFLRILEKYLHGEVSAQTKKTRAKQEYVELVRELANFES